MSKVLYAAEKTAIMIEGAAKSLRLLNESAEKESGCLESEVGTEREILKAVCLMRRFPMYLATYDLILRDLQQCTEELDKAVKKHYKRKREESG